MSVEIRFPPIQCTVSQRAVVWRRCSTPSNSMESMCCNADRCRLGASNNARLTGSVRNRRRNTLCGADRHAVMGDLAVNGVGCSAWPSPTARRPASCRWPGMLSASPCIPPEVDIAYRYLSLPDPVSLSTSTIGPGSTGMRRCSGLPHRRVVKSTPAQLSQSVATAA